MDECEEDLLARHRQEKKDLQAKITALRHSVAKNDKKRKKELTDEITKLEADLKERHSRELLERRLADGDEQISKEDHSTANAVDHITSQTAVLMNGRTDDEDGGTASTFSEGGGLAYVQTRISKAQKRRDKKASETRQREEEIRNELASQGDTERSLEKSRLRAVLRSRHLRVHEIPSDGDCLFGAVAHQLSIASTRQMIITVPELRDRSTATMEDKSDEFLPFLTRAHIDCVVSGKSSAAARISGDGRPEEDGADGAEEEVTLEDFRRYCAAMRETKAWGGQLELMALSASLDRAIEVIQADGPSILIGSGGGGRQDSDPQDTARLLISYHRHEYQLGEHYNSLVPVIIEPTNESNS